MKKQNLIIGAILLLIAATILIFFLRNITHKESPDIREIIRDSIRIHQQKADAYRDSASFYHQKVIKHETVLDSIRGLDSTRWAHLRESYLSTLEESIRREDSASLAR